MTSFQKRATVVLALAAILLAMLLSLRPGQSSAAGFFPPPPEPNGYEDFLKASQLIDAQVPDLTNSPALVLRPVVQRNQAALELVRTGLNRQSRVPLQFNLNYLTTHMTEIGGLKNLARLLVAEGVTAQADEKFDEAAQKYLDVIRLAQATAQGGLIIDQLVAQAIQALGAGHLRHLIEHLKSSEARRLIEALDVMDRHREPFEQICRRERAYFRKVHGWWLVNAPRLLFLIKGKGDPTQVAQQAAEATSLRGQAQLRLLIVHLALHEYKLDLGSYPESLSGLVPKYLAALPKDPFSGKDLVYRIEDGAYRLYSIGPDQKDDGGIPPTTRTRGQISQGDILLD